MDNMDLNPARFWTVWTGKTEFYATDGYFQKPLVAWFGEHFVFESCRAHISHKRP